MKRSPIDPGAVVRDRVRVRVPHLDNGVDYVRDASGERVAQHREARTLGFDPIATMLINLDDYRQKLHGEILEHLPAGAAKK